MNATNPGKLSAVVTPCLASALAAELADDLDVAVEAMLAADLAKSAASVSMRFAGAERSVEIAPLSVVDQLRRMASFGDAGAIRALAIFSL